MEGRLGEQPERLPAGEHRRQLPAEQLVDDEARVVAGHVQLAQQGREGGDVHCQSAVGEHLVEGPFVLPLGHIVDVDAEGATEGVADVVGEGDDLRAAFAQPLALVDDRVRGEFHAILPGGGGLIPPPGWLGRRGCSVTVRPLRGATVLRSLL